MITTDFWGKKLDNSHFQKCKLWNWYPNVWFFLAVKLNLLFTESACTYILLDKNSLFYLFIFLFSYLLNSAADHNIFIWGLNILEELEPSFLLSCHFPPWKWRAYGRHPPWILKQQEGPDFNSYILSSVTLGIFCSCKAKDVIRICHTDGA